MDDVDADAEAGAEPQYLPDVLGNVGLIEGEIDGDSVAPGISLWWGVGIVSQRPGEKGSQAGQASMGVQKERAFHAPARAGAASP